MPLSPHLKPLALASAFREDDPASLYWSDGEIVFYRHTRVAGADPRTFGFFLGSFARDARHCYRTHSRLRGADPDTFRALNFTYFRDARHIWTLGGDVKGADVDTFEVCDDGVYVLATGTVVPYGYARDRRSVYYYDFDGKPTEVRKAIPASFVSLNDGLFGRDERFVFCGGTVVSKASLSAWRKLEGHYSTDGTRVFYFNRVIDGADPASFRVVASPLCQLARDDGSYYWNDRRVEEREFQELLARP